MATFKYTGVTAYVENNDYTKDCLRLLAEVLYPLVPFADMFRDLLPEPGKYASRKNFDLLEFGAGYLCKDDDMYPLGTPDEYIGVSVTDVEIKGVKLTRLYFPVVSDNETDKYTEALINFLKSVYGLYLLNIKTKSALEYEEFEKAPTVVAYSIVD